MVLLSLTGALAFVLGFLTLTADQSMRTIIYGGYWMILLITGLFVRSLWKICRVDWTGWGTWRSAPRWTARSIAGAWYRRESTSPCPERPTPIPSC